MSTSRTASKVVPRPISKGLPGKSPDKSESADKPVKSSSKASKEESDEKKSVKTSPKTSGKIPVKILSKPAVKPSVKPSAKVSPKPTAETSPESDLFEKTKKSHTIAELTKKIKDLGGSVDGMKAKDDYVHRYLELTGDEIPTEKSDVSEKPVSKRGPGRPPGKASAKVSGKPAAKASGKPAAKASGKPAAKASGKSVAKGSKGKKPSPLKKIGVEPLPEDITGEPIGKPPLSPGRRTPPSPGKGTPISPVRPPVSPTKIPLSPGRQPPLSPGRQPPLSPGRQPPLSPGRQPPLSPGKVLSPQSPRGSSGTQGAISLDDIPDLSGAKTGNPPYIPPEVKAQMTQNGKRISVGKIKALPVGTTGKPPAEPLGLTLTEAATQY